MGRIAVLQLAVLEVLKQSNATVNEIAAILEKPDDAIRKAVRHLKAKQLIVAWGYSIRYLAINNIVYMIPEVPTEYVKPVMVEKRVYQTEGGRDRPKRDRRVARPNLEPVRIATFPLPVGIVATSVFDLAKGLK